MSGTRQFVCEKKRFDLVVSEAKYAKSTQEYILHPLIFHIVLF